MSSQDRKRSVDNRNKDAADCFLTDRGQFTSRIENDYPRCPLLLCFILFRVILPSRITSDVNATVTFD
ncbi:hypothetical protein CEXT_113681 [Caerostris extrusa]|uniref:Uncharacterized protein n=1 Tax=Caerostris extrusa TaxID=172846 RepID=A0AAV4QUH4_CAEEX|nr:hypothetical protein CEXT_113681 [Caerostris extrusa]